MFHLKRQRSALSSLAFLLVMAVMAVMALRIAPTSAQANPPTTPHPDLFLDVQWYHDNLIAANDVWNGGLDGASGMGAYRDDFGGFFHMNLDHQFHQTRMPFSTSVAQSRGIYMNIEAYRASKDERFLNAAIVGTNFLLAHFHDPDDGGYFWEVDQNGTVVDDQKQGYGNVHPLLMLAKMYEITQRQDYLDAALLQLDVLKAHFLDPDYPGGILPGFNRDFSEVIGVKNIDTFTHFFEALLALYDATEGAQQQEVAALIQLHGDYLVGHLYHDQDGFTDRGYVAYNYDDAWQPSQLPYTRATQWSGALQASTGHNIELAYLLSRAVERGFSPAWLATANKLIKFCLEYTLDPKTGGMLYDVTDYSGNPLPGNPDNSQLIYWPQAETARALLHFTVVRGADYAEPFKQVEALFNGALIDSEYGGLYHSVDVYTLTPGNGDTSKGDVWKANYHFSMYFAEVLRLAQAYPERVAELNAAFTP